LGFKIHSTDDGRTPAIEYLPVSAITPKAGMALYMTGGKLAIAAGTTKPTYISAVEKEVACAAGDLIPVIRVQPDMVLGTTASAAMTSVSLGSKVTIATGGLQVTATTTDGICEVVAMDGNAAGCEVLVRIV
jgi:hypothetical protein